MALYLARIVTIAASMTLIAGCDSMPQPTERKNDHLSHIEEELEQLSNNKSLSQELGAEEAGAEWSYDDWYPDDITPPPGTRYRCALTPLPRTMKGIPTVERRYLNHTFSMILKLIQAKLVLQQSLAMRSDMPRISADYERVHQTVLNTIQAEPVPKGLERFHQSIVRAVSLHLQWEREAVKLISQKGEYSKVTSFPSARSSSEELMNAGKTLAARYPEISQHLAHSMKHHLCALDILS